MDRFGTYKNILLVCLRFGDLCFRPSNVHKVRKNLRLTPGPRGRWPRPKPPPRWPPEDSYIGSGRRRQSRRSTPKRSRNPDLGRGTVQDRSERGFSWGTSLWLCFGSRCCSDFLVIHSVGGEELLEWIMEFLL